MQPTPRDLTGIIFPVAAVYFFSLLYSIGVIERTVLIQDILMILLKKSAELPWAAVKEHNRDLHQGSAVLQALSPNSKEIWLLGMGTVSIYRCLVSVSSVMTEAWPVWTACPDDSVDS